MLWVGPKQYLQDPFGDGPKQVLQAGRWCFALFPTLLLWLDQMGVYANTLMRKSVKGLKIVYIDENRNLFGFMVSQLL